MKAFVQTFGCQMNEHDSLRMKEMLDQLGYERVPSAEGADLVILNTCSVRDLPEHKVYSQVGRLAQQKAQQPNLVVAVAGCVAQPEGKTILKRYKVVDLVFGPDQIFSLPEMLAEVAQGKRVLRTAWLPRDKKIQNFIPTEELDHFTLEGPTGNIAITKGCDNFCTFCIVPTTRGRLVSREPENILAEAKTLLQKGAKELWLLGQNVNAYQAGEAGFGELLAQVAALPGLMRLRFSSPHPNDWTNRLTDLMAANPVICPALHLPLQAGSDRILKAMHRDHNQAQFLDKVAYLKDKIPQIGLSSDIMVGFPGESEANFQDTLKVMQLVRFHQVYAFKYSPRPGTKAKAMGDDISETEKASRLEQVLNLHERIRSEVLQAEVGNRHEVLIDAAHPREQGVMTGRSANYLPVALQDAQAEIGDLVQVRITERRPHSLQGVRLD